MTAAAERHIAKAAEEPAHIGAVAAPAGIAGAAWPPESTEETLDFGKWQAFVGFGFPQPDGEQHAPGTPHHNGRALVAQIGPNRFLVTGINARVTFRLAPGQPGQIQILKAEQGAYDGTTWKPLRIWNGDQTDRGLNFETLPQYVQIHLGTY